MRFFFCLILSILIHISLIFVFAATPLIEKPKHMVCNFIKKEKILDLEITIDIESSNSTCQNAYNGIGVELGSTIMNGVKIGRVARGYPADRANLQKGDILLTKVNYIRSQKVGTKIQIQYIRNEKIITKDIIIERICLE
jgi:C-terminal processing protease CtpA/Prc